MLRGAVGCLAALVAASAAAHEAHDHEAEPLPVESGPRPLYEVPSPGTYELPAIRRVGGHSVVDSQGRSAELPGLAPGQVAVVSFIYRGCADAQGCPLALAELRKLDRALAGLPLLAPSVRLVTCSFDPDRDGPGAMAELREHMSPRGDWRFLTAPEGLTELLDDYGQDARALATADGEETGLFRHVLKVFLVDARGSVRNVYSSGLLDAKLLLADIQTLMVED